VEKLHAVIGGFHQRPASQQRPAYHGADREDARGPPEADV
jgi:hypothetical protein